MTTTAAPEAFGENTYIPKVTKIAEQLDSARAHLAALPRPSLFEDTVSNRPVWEHTEQHHAEAVEHAQADVRQLELLLAVHMRTTLQHVIDVVSCIPQERDNYQLLREAERYLLALAKIQEQLS
jgi:hypothetical protein